MVVKKKQLVIPGVLTTKIYKINTEDRSKQYTAMKSEQITAKGTMSRSSVGNSIGFCFVGATLIVSINREIHLALPTSAPS